MTELRRRMIADMSLRCLSEAAQRAYVDAVRNLARHFNRSPDLLLDEEVRRFFISLKRRRSKSTVRVHLFAIKFIYRYTLGRPSPMLDLIRLKRDRKLPAVLSHGEVRQLLAHIRRPQARIAALPMYSCGLRVSQAVHLTIPDVDSRRMVLCLRHGKGGQVYACDHCGHQEYSYHSCRNRSCPKCHARDTEAWLTSRRKELLPVAYFHLVFTLPEELRPLLRWGIAGLARPHSPSGKGSAMKVPVFVRFARSSVGSRRWTRCAIPARLRRFLSRRSFAWWP